MIRSGLLAAVLATTAGTSHAFVPEREPAVVAASSVQPRIARRVEAAHVAGWQALRDRDTGVVIRMWGRHVDAPGAMLDPAIAERAARDFLAAHRDQLAPGSGPADFVLAANRIDGHLRTVAFTQTWNGLRVVGGQLHVVFANDRLFVAGSEALPNVHATPTRARPASPARAEAWLRREVRGSVAMRPTGERVVLPIVRGKGDLAFHVADRVEATAGLGRWDVYVAPDGAPLLRVNRVHLADGTLQYDVGDRHPAGPRSSRNVSRANITADGVAITTAADGSFTWAGTAAATVIPSLVGSVVLVVNEAGTAATAMLTAQPGSPVVWSLAADELGDAQLAAYIYGTISKARAKLMHPALAWLDQPLEIHVNANASCNALSTGDAIYFFRRSATCENTARLADVVHHEFGHSFHNQSIIPGAGAMDGTITEGLADYFSANVADDPAVGRGFSFTDAPVRDLDPPGIERVFPGDITSSPHETGLIIGGALWDLRKALIAKHGPAQGVVATEQIFVGILQRAPDLAGTYVAALTADDDDGDLGNGTPNGCAIEAAFGRHGLAGPDYRPLRLVATATGLTIDVRVEPAATACPVAQVTAMKLAWATGGGGVLDVPMIQQGASWTGAIPPQPAGTVISYQVIATLEDGSTQLLPENPADPRYQLFAGPATEIWCERFETDPQWEHTGANEWDVGTPTNVAAGDPAAAFAGSGVLGTDVRGDGFYRANLTTSIKTPLIDASAYQRVHVQFRRWLTIEDGTADRASIAVGGAEVWSNATDFDHVDKEWRFVDLDVSAQAAEPLQIEWTLTSDASRNLGGWNLDEVCVVGLDKIPRCGDGVVDPDETCDDLNMLAGDGCSDTCREEPGEAGCCSAGADPTGPLVLGLGVIGLLARRRRARL